MTSQDVISATRSPHLAVLFQAIDPPLIEGARKPRKPGGIGLVAFWCTAFEAQ